MPSGSKFDIDELVVDSCDGLANQQFECDLNWRVHSSIHSSQYSIVELKPGAKGEVLPPAELVAVRLVVTRPDHQAMKSGDDSEKALQPLCVAAFHLRESVWKQQYRSPKWNPTASVLSLCVADSFNHVEEEDDEVGDGGTDLQKTLAPLSRQQLELLLAQMIDRHQSCFGLVSNELNRPVDCEPIKEALHNCILSLGIEDAVEDLVEEVVAAAGRARAFVGAGSSQNAVAVLQAVNETLIGFVSEIGDVPKPALAGAWVELEQAWMEVFEFLGRSDVIVYKEMKSVFQTLAESRQRLIAVAGPVFSDPLRFLKSVIQERKKRSAPAHTGLSVQDSAGKKSKTS